MKRTLKNLGVYHNVISVIKTSMNRHDVSGCISYELPDGTIVTINWHKNIFGRIVLS